MFIADSKLIFLLKSFSGKDIKEFKKLISSSFFSKGRNYLALLNRLLKYQKKSFKSFTPQKLYSNLYPGKKFRIQTLNNRFSELFKLAEEYLILKTLKENKSEKNKLLLMAYHQNRLDRLFEKQLKKSKKYINSINESDSKFFDITALNRLNISYLKNQKISENTFKHYFEHTQYLTGLFLKNLFAFGIEFIQQEQANRNYDFNLALEILNRLNVDETLINKLGENNLKIFKIVVMQFYLYDIFKSPDHEKNYFEARKIFEELDNVFDETDKIELYKLMISYCIIRINNGVKKFRSELFKLYNERLRNKIYLDGNKIFPVTNFRNYVLLGIIMKKIMWTENFIKKYSKELPEENREDEIKLSYSRLFFSNRNYVKSLQYLIGFKGLNYLHYCDSSILKLCTYYETRKFEEAFSEIDKFRHYLRNHREIPKIHKEHASNFLKIYQKILKIKSRDSEKDLYIIENILKRTKPVSRLSWLTEKIKELEKSN